MAGTSAQMKFDTRKDFADWWVNSVALDVDAKKAKMESKGWDLDDVADHLLKSGKYDWAFIKEDNPESFGDVDVGKTLKNVATLEGFGKLAGEGIQATSETIMHPIESGKGIRRLADGLTSKLTGGKSLRDEAGMVSDEAKQSADALVDQLGKELSPATLQNDPFRFASTGSAVLPVRGGLGLLSKLSGPVGTGAKIARRTLDVVDPQTAPIASIQEGRKAVGGVRQGIRDLRNESRLPEGDSRNAITRAVGEEEGGPSLAQETAGGGLAVSANVPQRAFVELNRTAADPVGRMGAPPIYKGDLVKKFSTMEGNKRNDRLVMRAHRGADRLHRDARKEYNRATTKLQPILKSDVPDLNYEDLQAMLVDHVEPIGLNIKVVGGGKGEGPKRYSVTWGTETPIEGLVANKRDRLRTAMEKVLNMGWKKNPDPRDPDLWIRTPIKGEEIHAIRQDLDDLISTFSADTEVTARARKGFSKMRGAMATWLESYMGPEYQKQMAKYRQHMELLDDADEWLGVTIGQRTGKRLDASANHRALNTLGRVYQRGVDQRTREGVFNRFQEAIGDETLTPNLIAIHTQDPSASGLVARAAFVGIPASVASGVGAGLAAGGAAGLGVLGLGLVGTAAVAAMINPRLMGRALASAPHVADWYSRNANRLKAVSKRDPSKVEKVFKTLQQTIGRGAFDEARLVQRLENELQGGTEEGDITQSIGSANPMNQLQKAQ